MPLLAAIEKIVASFYLAKICLLSISSILESFIQKFWWDRGYLAAQSSDFSHRRNGEEIDILIFVKIVRIDFHFILGVVAGHHGSSNKIINYKIPITIQNSPFLFEIND